MLPTFLMALTLLNGTLKGKKNMVFSAQLGLFTHF